jgi:hypothetical protein
LDTYRLKHGTFRGKGREAGQETAGKRTPWQNSRVGMNWKEAEDCPELNQMEKWHRRPICSIKGEK